MKSIENSHPILEVTNLSVTIGNLMILEDLNFSLERGSIMAVIGPNGSGKTTLFRALMGLIPCSGRVVWHNVDRMGYLPQSLIVTDLPISVEEFLKLKPIRNIKEALSLAKMDKEILSMRLSNLSGGQLQRVLLAWAVGDRPSVLLFDEPTSFVDIGSEEPIYEALKEMPSKLGITILLISHNMHVVSHYSDYVLALNRKQMLFGRTNNISHSRLFSLMSGVDSEYPGME